ncbi:hypothetical protein JMJ76_0005000 [Colletotrichum scovillei]|nr:hypothetical protein JMJ76_0005000 [Colletotrichum scovillei]
MIYGYPRDTQTIPQPAHISLQHPQRLPRERRRLGPDAQAPEVLLDAVGVVHGLGVVVRGGPQQPREGADGGELGGGGEAPKGLYVLHLQVGDDVGGVCEAGAGAGADGVAEGVGRVGGDVADEGAVQGEHHDDGLRELGDAHGADLVEGATAAGRLGRVKRAEHVTEDERQLNLPQEQLTPDNDLGAALGVVLLVGGILGEILDTARPDVPVLVEADVRGPAVDEGAPFVLHKQSPGEAAAQALFPVRDGPVAAVDVEAEPLAEGDELGGEGPCVIAEALLDEEAGLEGGDLGALHVVAHCAEGEGLEGGLVGLP